MKRSLYNSAVAAAILILIFAVAIGCTSLRNPGNSLGDVSKFISAIAEADAVLVYEGLPPEGTELYATEIKRPDLVWFEGYPFYAKILDVSADDKKRLTAIALEKESHVALTTVSRDDDAVHL